MKERSFACLMWIAAFMALAVGCAVNGHKNPELKYYAVGSVLIAWALWKSESGKSKVNEN